MRLPFDVAAGPVLSSSSSSTAASSFFSVIASSPISLSAIYTFKSILQQQQQQGLHQKREVYIENRHSWVVDLVLCILSLLGALTIIVPYCCTKHSRKLRHSLILGLATSDLASSLIIIATNAVALAGGDLSKTVRFCQFSGYTFQVAVWTQNLWNLSIAIITYMILVHPLSSFNSWVERNLIWFWPVFWILSFAVNAVIWPVTNFGNVGGYCSFNGDRGGAYFAAVFTFVPRAFVVCVILVLYTHLFFFLRRVNMFNRATSLSNQISSAGGAGRSRDSNRHTTTKEGEGKSSDEALVDSARDASPDRRWSSASGISSWFKWKRSMSQSSASPQGSNSLRQGSGSSQGKSSLGGPKMVEQQVPVLELDEYPAEISPKTVPNDIPPSPNSIKRTQPTVVPIIRSPPPSKRLATAETTGSEPSFIQTQRRSSTAHFDIPDEDDDDDEDEEDEAERRRKNLPGLLEMLKPMPLRRDVKDFGMTSTPREHLKHFSLSPAGADNIRKAKEEEAGESTDRTLNGDSTTANDVPTYESMLGQNWTWGMPVGLTSEKAASSPISPISPTTPSKAHFRLFSKRRSNGADQLGTDTYNSHSTIEHEVESLGSTLNRQASILLLLYPAAYCILFSISIIRIIVDISNPNGSAASKAQRNENLLHTVSRWTIFAQGAIDALVFQFVERSFRMRMKRKRRIAAGEDVPDFWLDVWVKKIKNMTSKSSTV